MDYRPLLLLGLLVPLASTGCSVRVLVDDDGSETEAETETGLDPSDTETETGPDPSDTEGETGEPETGDPETGDPEPADCASLCAAPVEGSCLLVDACVSECEAKTPGWPPELVEAFATCVATDPVCFVSMDSCMLGQLHPEGTPFDIHLAGFEFDAYEGAAVHAYHDSSPNPIFGGSSTIVAGEFEFDWTEAVWANAESGIWIAVWVDVDADEQCTAADLASMVTLDWNGDLLDPAWYGEHTPPAETNEFVCGLVP